MTVKFIKDESLKALLIEDNPFDADLLMEALASPGVPPVQLCWVEGLSDAFAKLETEVFDVILLDLILPDGDSLSAMKNLRCKLKPVPVPIIILTGLDDQAIALEALKNGAQDYLIKGRPSGESIYRSMRYAIERIHVREALVETTKRARDAEAKLALLEQRQEFVAMLAHDLRTPISGCQRVLSLMLQGATGELNEQQGELVSKMMASNKSMLEMINNVLETYQLESESPIIHCTEVNLAPIVDSCLAELLPVAEAQGLHLEAFCRVARTVHADPIAIHRVLNNLISNAIKFTPRGGQIVLEAQERENEVVVRVTDTGIGMTEEEISHIFERFWQAKTRYRAKGIGLGLYLCQELLRQQNGHISCESVPGVGTTFEVVLSTFSDTDESRFAARAREKPMRIVRQNEKRTVAAVRPVRARLAEPEARRAQRS